MKRIPGVGWYAAAGAVLLAGMALAAALIWRYVANFEQPTRFLAPGSAQVTLAQAGDYVIWHEHRTLYEGRSFDVPAALPDGTRYGVQAPDGRALAVEPYGGMSAEGTHGQSVSVARFEATQAGDHRVAVEGAFESRVIAVGPNRLWPILRLAGEVFVLLALALGAAIAVGLYGFLRTLPVASSAAGSTADAEESLRKLAGLVYGLQAASLLVGVTAIAGVIINYLRRGQVQGTWLESHFTWQIRTFWWSLAWCILGVVIAKLAPCLQDCLDRRTQLRKFAFHATASIASSTSARWSAADRATLDDADRVFAGFGANAWLHCGLRDGFHFPAQYCLQVLGQANEVEQAASRLQLNHEIEVAFRTLLTSGGRAEQLKARRRTR